MNDLFQTGSYSILLGNNYYKKYFPSKNRLLKITSNTTCHNEQKYLDIIRSIPEYSKYYSIPDDIGFIIKPTNKLYIYLTKIIMDKTLFTRPLKCYYIDYAGDKEMLDTIKDLNKNDFSIWKSYKVILKFINKILNSINYLHKKQICHLDLKPENIIINTTTKEFKIIDFGFSSKEPFDDYVSNMRGTYCYFPKQFDKQQTYLWLPKIEANDCNIINGQMRFLTNRKLVYKIDSYCLGRILYFLKYMYDDNVVYYCYNNEKKTEKKIDRIIKSLLINDVQDRLTITECLSTYFNN